MQSLPVALLLRADSGVLQDPISCTFGPGMTVMELARSAINQLGQSDVDLEPFYAGVVVGLPAAGEEPWKIHGRALRTIVLPDNRFNWYAHFPHVKYEDLARTADAGVCASPEDGITLIVSGGYGGLEGVDWQFLLETLDKVDQYLVNIGALYGGITAIRDLYRRARKVVKRAAEPLRRLANYGSRPSPTDVEFAIDDMVKPRLDVLAKGLSLSPPQVVALLELLGYVPRDDSYEISSSNVHRLTRLLYDSAARSDAVEQHELEEFLPRLRDDMDSLFRSISEGDSSALNPDDESARLLGTPGTWTPPS